MYEFEVSSSLNFSEIELELTQRLNELEEICLQDFSEIKGRSVTIQSLHGTISSSKSSMLNLVTGKWTTHHEYISDWLSSFAEFIETGRHSMMKEMFPKESLREYTFTYLTRDFYRHYKERIRVKPQENLWSVWFGSGKFVWGILIAPRYSSENGWYNKPKLVRRAEFRYWTIGHVIRTGLINPDSTEIYHIPDIDSLLRFYEHIIKRQSHSKYELEVFNFYSKYVRKSNNPYDEPLLIPEFRYGGLDTKHKYRLDFTLLNSETGERIGFEFSPSSSHMAIQGAKSKTQKQLNEELGNQWNKEMVKRNEYFQQYGVHTITYTDSHLADMDKCLNEIEVYLQQRGRPRKNVESYIQEILLKLSHYDF